MPLVYVAIMRSPPFCLYEYIVDISRLYNLHFCKSHGLPYQFGKIKGVITKYGLILNLYI